MQRRSSKFIGSFVFVCAIATSAPCSTTRAQYLSFPSVSESANLWTFFAMPLHLWMVSAEVADGYSRHPGFECGWAVGELLGAVALGAWHSYALSANVQTADGRGTFFQGLGLALSSWYVIHAALSLADVWHRPPVALSGISIEPSANGLRLAWSGKF